MASNPYNLDENDPLLGATQQELDAIARLAEAVAPVNPPAHAWNKLRLRMTAADAGDVRGTPSGDVPLRSDHHKSPQVDFDNVPSPRDIADTSVGSRVHKTNVDVDGSSGSGEPSSQPFPARNRKLGPMLPPVPPTPESILRGADLAGSSYSGRAGNRWLMPILGLSLAASIAASVGVVWWAWTTVPDLRHQAIAARVEVESAKQNAIDATAKAQSLEVELKNQMQLLATLRRDIETRDQQLTTLNSMLGNNKVKLASMAPAAEGQVGVGRVFWDAGTGKWLVYISEMRPLPEGREYQLWFLTPDNKAVPSKTFVVDVGGKASLSVEVPTGITPVAAAISDEPIGGSQSPTGTIRLVGNLQ